MTGNGHVVGVIEDDVSVRGALSRLFRSAGFEVSLFATAEEFIADPHHADIDCLVIDIGLPGMSGLELLEHVRVENKSRSATIVITAHDDGQAQRRAIAAGAQDFFTKPFNNRQLQAAVSKAMSRKKNAE